MSFCEFVGNGGRVTTNLENLENSGISTNKKNSQLILCNLRDSF